MITGSSERIEIFYKEICILEICKCSEIAEYTCSHQVARPRPVFPANQCRTHRIVKQDRGKYQPQVGRIPPAVEKQGCTDQPGYRYPVVAIAADHVEHQQYYWQKYEDEFYGIKQHARLILYPLYMACHGMPAQFSFSKIATISSPRPVR